MHSLHCALTETVKPPIWNTLKWNKPLIWNIFPADQNFYYINYFQHGIFKNSNAENSESNLPKQIVIYSEVLNCHGGWYNRGGLAIFKN